MFFKFYRDLKQNSFTLERMLLASASRHGLKSITLKFKINTLVYQSNFLGIPACCQFLHCYLQCIRCSKRVFHNPICFQRPFYKTLQWGYNSFDDLGQKQTQAPRCSMCKGADTLTGFVIKKVLGVTVLLKLAGLVYTQQHCCWLGSKLFLWLIWITWNTFILLNKPCSLANFCAHELMIANTLCHYLISWINECAKLLYFRTWKGWSDSFVREKSLEKARWVNSFSIKETCLQVCPPMRGQLGFMCVVPFPGADLPKWCKTGFRLLIQSCCRLSHLHGVSSHTWITLWNFPPLLKTRSAPGCWPWH